MAFRLWRLKRKWSSWKGKWICEEEDWLTGEVRWYDPVEKSSSLYIGQHPAIRTIMSCHKRGDQVQKHWGLHYSVQTVESVRSDCCKRWKDCVLHMKENKLEEDTYCWCPEPDTRKRSSSLCNRQPHTVTSLIYRQGTWRLGVSPFKVSIMGIRRMDLRFQESSSESSLVLEANTLTDRVPVFKS